MSFTLTLGDSLAGMAAMADKSVDVTCSDPPYSEHVHTRSRRGVIEHEAGTGRAAFNRNRDLGFAHITQPERVAFAEQYARLTRRWVLVFSDTESDYLWREALTGAGLEYVRTCFWHKIGGTPQFTGDRPGVACEAITVAHPKGRKRWNGGGRAGFYDFPIMLDRGGKGARVNESEKPVDLLSALLRDFSEPGELVLDSHAGHATTGVAALKLGRRFVGWELRPHMHAAALKRLTATREQSDLFEKRPKPKQAALVGV